MGAPEVEDPEPGPVAGHVRTALRERADLNEARLRIRRGDLELVRPRNGLLPRLDLFIRFGGSRYAVSVDTTGDLDGMDRDIAAGLTLSHTLGTRATRRLREESFRIESENLRLGRGTALLVAQAWRDPVAARISEVGVVIDVRTALLELQRVRGILLESRGLAVEPLD